MRFLHIADVHLGAKPDRGKVWSDRRAEEIEASFKNILKVCEEQQVDLLLIAGDLFDGQPSLSRLKNIDYLLSCMPYTKTLIIAGDSDYIESGACWENYRFNSNTIVFPRDRAASVYLEDINVSVTGYSYGKAEYTERILEKLAPAHEGAYNILLGHGGDVTHMPFSKKKLAERGFDYVALGHIHKPSHILKDKMAFSGSLEPLGITETGRHGYIMGEVNGEGETRIEFVPYATRSYVTMKLMLSEGYTNADVMDAVRAQITKTGEKHIYRILLGGVISHDVEINLSSLTREYNIYDIIDDTEYSYDMDELVTDNRQNLFGRFVERLGAEDSTEDEETRSKALKYGIDAILGI